jgi:uncharacterized protein
LATDLDRFERLVDNALMLRESFMDRLFDPHRNLNEECGYPPDGTSGGSVDADAHLYRALFDREPIAERVCSVLAKECWQVQPIVYEDEDPDTETEFEAAWRELGQSLRGGRSWFRSAAGSLVWDYCKRLDIVSGIGHFGIMLIGLDDGKPLSEPAEGVELRRTGGSLRGSVQGTDAQYFAVNVKLRKVLFLRVFDESLVQIVQYDADMSSPRYGQPMFYNVTFNDPRDTQGGIGLSTTTVRVHWTRVLHVADNKISSEVFGVPRQRPVLNRLLDLRKLYGGSAEMYWRGAFPGYSIETVPQLGGDVEVDEAGVRAKMQDYIHGLQRYMLLAGLSMKSLAPQVSDPTAQIEVQLTAVCVQLAMPKRVFMGSERGEMSSAQDDSKWNDVVRERELGHCTASIVVPLVDRLIAVGALPEPEQFYVSWPDIESLSAQAKATVASTCTAALVQYASGGGDALVPAPYFLTHFLGFTDKEAESMLDAAAASMDPEQHDDDTQPSPLLGMVGGINGMISLFQLAQAGGLSEEQLKQQIMQFFRVSEERADQIIADGLSKPLPSKAAGGLNGAVS